MDEAGVNLAGVQQLLSVAETMQRIRPLMQPGALQRDVTGEEPATAVVALLGMQVGVLRLRGDHRLERRERGLVLLLAHVVVTKRLRRQRVIITIGSRWLIDLDQFFGKFGLCFSNTSGGFSGNLPIGSRGF